MRALNGDKRGETAVFAGCSICRSAIGQVEFLICARRHQCRHIVFAKSTRTRQANKRCLFITQSGITCPSFIYKKFLLTLSSRAEYGKANECNFQFEVANRRVKQAQKYRQMRNLLYPKVSNFFRGNEAGNPQRARLAYLVWTGSQLDRIFVPTRVNFTHGPKG